MKQARKQKKDIYIIIINEKFTFFNAFGVKKVKYQNISILKFSINHLFL